MPRGEDHNDDPDDQYEGRERPAREDEEGERRERRRGRRRERWHEDESWDDPEEHREIERQRFYGGLPATPERYALAREQWYRLPGAIGRSPVDPLVSDQAPDEQRAPGQAHSGEMRPER